MKFFKRKTAEEKLLLKQEKDQEKKEKMEQKTKDQKEKLDADFLDAVLHQKFKKIKKLLLKGAHPLAKDEEGNTALHNLALSKSSYKGFLGQLLKKDEIDELICLLLNEGLDINTPNKIGKTCMHCLAENDHKVTSELINMFLDHTPDLNIQDEEGRAFLHLFALNRNCDFDYAEKLVEAGADLTLKDNAGDTPVHLAVQADSRGILLFALYQDSSFHELKSGHGKYLHEIAKEAGNHNLSRSLLSQLAIYRDPEQKLTKKKGPVEVETEENDKWILLDEEKASHIKIEKELGYKLTEIFNFHTSVYTQITHNLETKVEAVTTKAFNEFEDKTLLDEALVQLQRLGGVVNKPLKANGMAKKKLPYRPKE